MCTSRRSLEMSIPTKSWFMTRPCECGLWRPKRLYGFEVEPVSRAPGSVTVFCGALDVHGLLPTLPLAVPTTEGDGKIQDVGRRRRRERATSQRRRWVFFITLLDLQPRVEGISQAVAEQVDAQHGDEDGEAGERS